MRDNTVVVDRSSRPAGLRFAPRFNAAVAFIDRHLEEGSHLVYQLNLSNRAWKNLRYLGS